MNVGVVGVGSMGVNHARIYSQMAGCKLVGVVDTDKARSKFVAEAWKSKALYDYRELLSEGVEAVSVVVPTSHHREVASFFLANGVDCLVEKPIAPNMADGEALVALAREKERTLMVGHIERFNPAVQKVKEIIKEGLLGKLLIISTRRVGPFAPRNLDVGIIVDLATHDIDVARYLTGAEPKNVYAKFSSIKHTMEDHAIILLDFGDCAASVEVNWFTPHKVRSAVLTGTGGIAYMDYIEQSLTVYNSEWKMEPKIEKEEPLKRELAHFIECIRKGEEPLVSGEVGLKTLEVALRCLRRMPEGRAEMVR